jgi:pimeloyl-ACP methyl ester carboxylesterase
VTYLDVPGARLHYKTVGTGPLLIMVGSPMDSGGFAPLASAMSADRTVVTYDPRGIGDSTRDDADGGITPELQADDVHRLIESLGGGPVDLFGSSGGATVGLALVTDHPDDIRTLVAHEPPVTNALPERDVERAHMQSFHDLYRTNGWAAAMAAFLSHIGIDPAGGGGGPAWEPTPEQLARMAAANEVFLGYVIRETTAFEPDYDALRAASTRIVIGVGATSTGQLAHRTGAAVAAILNVEPVVFPGGHVGFAAHPREFATTLAGLL